MQKINSFITLETLASNRRDQPTTANAIIHNDTQLDPGKVKLIHYCQMF